MGDTTKFRNTNPLKAVIPAPEPATSEDLFGDLLSGKAPAAPAPKPSAAEPEPEPTLGELLSEGVVELATPRDPGHATGPRLVLLDPPEPPGEPAPPLSSEPSVEIVEFVDGEPAAEADTGPRLVLDEPPAAPEPAEAPGVEIEVAPESPEQKRIASLTRLVARAREEQEKLEKKLSETRRERDEARLEVEGAGKAKAAAEAAAERARAETGAVRGQLEGKLEEARRNGPEPLIHELLPVVDYLDMALKAAPPGDPLVQGVELTRKALIDALARFEVKVVPTEGAPFDPKIHDAGAVESRPELSAPTVLEALRRGWTRGGKTLRPALVKVGKPPEA